LSGEVDVDVVLEDHGHGRQAEPAYRAKLLEVWQAAHGRFDWEGDGSFHLNRTHWRRLGEDLDLDRGDVWDGVDGQIFERYNPADDQERGEDQDKKAILDGQLKDALEHVGSFRGLLPLG